MPYIPHRNAMCEQFNFKLQNLIKMLSKDQEPNWSDYLPALVFAYNAIPHSSAGYQPYWLMLGNKA